MENPSSYEKSCNQCLYGNSRSGRICKFRSSSTVFAWRSSKAKSRTFCLIWLYRTYLSGSSADVSLLLLLLRQLSFQISSYWSVVYCQHYSHSPTIIVPAFSHYLFKTPLVTHYYHTSLFRESSILIHLWLLFGIVLHGWRWHVHGYLFGYLVIKRADYNSYISGCSLLSPRPSLRPCYGAHYRYPLPVVPRNQRLSLRLQTALRLLPLHCVCHGAVHQAIDLL